MSKLSELRSKGEDVTLSNGLIINVKPMTIDLEAEVGELYSQDKGLQALALLIKKTIIKSVPDATEEEINDMNKEDLKLLTTKILEMNGLSQDKKKS